MVQCSVLEYARRAVTVRRAENRVQWCRTVRPVLDGVGRFSSMRDGLSSVLVELDLEEEYQRVNGVGLQSQREAISAVVDERAGGANNIRSM